jgi:drug/metabolite transporter (DMT)-like permease
MAETDRAPGAEGPSAAGLLLGLVALSGWTGYVVVARHGALAGFSPFDLAVARLAPAGLAFLPFLVVWGLRDLAGIGWRRGLVLALFGGPLFGFLMAGGFTLAPVTHAAVIGPATLTLGTTLIAAVWLGDRPGALRGIGLAIVLAGILMVGGGGFATGWNARILLGDLCLVAANLSFAVFTVLLRVWRVPVLRGGAVVTGLSSLVMLPAYLLLGDFAAVARIGWDQLALQWLGQGVFAGCIATIAYMAAVGRLGPSRGAVFPSAIPATAVAVGGPLLGEPPGDVQIAGVAVVSAGLLMAVGLLDRAWRRR